MPNTVDFLMKRIKIYFAPHGVVADFCRKTGIHRNTVEGWLSTGHPPKLEKLDRIAEGMGITLWDLLKPEGEEKKVSPRLEALLKVIQDQEARIQELEAGTKTETKESDPLIREFPENWNKLEHRDRRKLGILAKDMVAAARNIKTKDSKLG